MEYTNQESHDMSKLTTQAPTSEDTALMTRLGLLLGDHRVTTVKTQAHNHPVLNHHNNIIGFSSTERRKKAHLYTTSPASTLSDKGIGSSVGSFDSEFRSNLAALAETGVCSNRTGSLDSRTADIVSHSRTDSGIPNHSRSSSDIILTRNITDVSKPRLAQQCEEKLWNADPRRHSGNTQTLAGPEIRSSRVPSVGKARRADDKSADTWRERENSSSSDIMKLPQLCLDSPNNSHEPSIHSSVSSSRSLTPAASVCDVGNYKLMKRTLSSHSNNVFDSEPLPPPPPPPPVRNYYDNHQDLPPPPPPPPVSEDMASNHSRASSSDRTLSNEDFQLHYREENNNFLQQGRVLGKPPINRPPMYAPPNLPQMPPPRVSPHFYDQSGTSMIQMLRASSGMTRSTPSPKDPRMITHARQWPSDHEIAVSRTQLPSSMSAMDISHSRQSSANSSYAGSGVGLWEESRPHSLSTPRQNPVIQNLLHKTSASFDNSGFHRRVGSRSSTRSNERRMPLSNASSSSDMRVGRMPPYRLPDVNLHCLQFDLPWAIMTDTKFVGREWLFGEIMNSFSIANSKLNKGVIIYGKEGTGKTSIIHQLESTSYNGTRKFHQVGSNATLNKPDYESIHRIGGAAVRSGSPRLQRHAFNHSNNSSRTGSPAFGISSAQPGSRSGSQTSLSGEEAQKRLSSQVVAHHYCQADNNTTCYVPEFLHSVSAQLAQAPQLTAYREFLLEQPGLQNLLSLRSCVQNPSQALKEAILEPLIALRQNNKLPRINLLILIDGLGEAEVHRRDHGHSILTFLQRHLPEFPDFLKVVVTCRTEDKPALGKLQLPLFQLSIDYEETNVNVTRDIQTYIATRIAASKSLSSLTLIGKPDTATTQKLLTAHLLSKCEGNMLYLRLTLDLMDSGKLVPKSAGFKVVPVNLSEAFLLMCNLKFTSTSSFVRVRDIIAVALASLYPLKDEQIYKAITSGFLTNDLPIDEFHYLMNSVSQFLVIRPSDNRRSFIHPCFREWLTHGNLDDNQISNYSSSRKFAVDPKRGHALLATVLSRQPPSRLNEHAALELAHHLLKARMFRGQSKTTGMNSNELHAVWMAQCSHHLSDSLASVRNLFYPNIKVSKLLLHSGADPNTRSQVLCEAPAICAAAHIGAIEFVKLLLTFRADINMVATNGMSCLAYAAAAGHTAVVELLLRYKPRLDLVDRNGHSPLLHAVSRNHLEIAILLLTCDLYVSPEQRKYSAVQALIAAATTGSLQLLRYLLDHPNPALHCDPDSVDPTRCESALTAAASRGNEGICEYLVRQQRANMEQRNKSGMTPLLCAVKQGEWETVHLFLNMGSVVEGADCAGRTPLIVAASVGHTGVMELLLSHGANVHSVDKEGLTALGWAALKGHMQCAKSLVNHGSDIRHPDKHGRTPIDLAAYSGNENIVDLLLDAGADFNHAELNNMSPLDRAVVSNNANTVSILLKRGAALTDSTWKLAVELPEVLALVLDKCLEDANYLYKDEKIREARDIYSTALYHLKEPVAKQQTSEENDMPQGPLRELTGGLLLGLARCARKLNDLETAEISSTRALDLNPHWYEALYVRARIRRETSRLSAALRDVEEAAANAPSHNVNEITRLMDRIRSEIDRCGKRNSTSESSENALQISGQRHNSFTGDIRRRVNSASSYSNHNNNNSTDSRSSSPSLSVASEFQLSRSYQQQYTLNGHVPSPAPKYHDRLPYLSNEIRYTRRNHSQDNVGESRMGILGGNQQQVPYQHRVKPIGDGYPVPQSAIYHTQIPASDTQHSQFNTTTRTAPPGHAPRRKTFATEL